MKESGSGIGREIRHTTNLPIQNEHHSLFGARFHNAGLIPQRKRITTSAPTIRSIGCKPDRKLKATIQRHFTGGTDGSSTNMQGGFLFNAGSIVKEASLKICPRLCIGQTFKENNHRTRRCSRQSRLHFCPLRLESNACALVQYGQASAPAAKRYVR